MTSFRIRPKFEIEHEMSIPQMTNRIKEVLVQEGNPFDAVETPGHLILKVKKEDQHYWSPQLNLMFIETEGNSGIKIKGRYEPHHNVWTLFILLYLAIAILILFLSIIGFSRMGLGMSAKILWVVPVLGAMAIGLYIVSQIGQKLGADETYSLHHFIEYCLDRKIHIK